jgi:hypothetical protein
MKLKHAGTLAMADLVFWGTRCSKIEGSDFRTPRKDGRSLE